MSKRPIALLAGAMAIAIVAAGCGSSSDDSTDTVVVLTKTEFIEQGDAICAKGSKKLSKEAEEFAEDNDIDTSKATEKQKEEVIEAVVGPVLMAEADELSELSAPEGEEDAVTAIVEALENGAEELEEDPAALLESESAGPLDEANKLAGEFGFKKCGQG